MRTAGSIGAFWRGGRVGFLKTTPNARPTFYGNEGMGYQSVFVNVRCVSDWTDCDRTVIRQGQNLEEH
jgi:hypothetical protein